MEVLVYVINHRKRQILVDEEGNLPGYEINSDIDICSEDSFHMLISEITSAGVDAYRFINYLGKSENKAYFSVSINNNYNLDKNRWRHVENVETPNLKI